MHTGQNHFSKPWLMQTDESSDNLWTELGAYLTASNLIVRKKDPPQKSSSSHTTILSIVNSQAAKQTTK